MESGQQIAPMDTREYLRVNRIPELFECLMTGLMYHRPTDYISYLEECLQKVRRQGLDGINWNMFIGPKSESAVPITKKEEQKLIKYTPTPGIDCVKTRLQSNVSIICVVAGPGLNKSSYCAKLINNYPSFVHLSMGDLLKNRAKLEANQKESKWQHAITQINSGELLPQDMVMESLIWNLNLNANTHGFIIDGFPRTAQQYDELKRQVGLDSIACVLLVDGSEEYCKQKLLERGQVDDFWKDHSQKAIDTRICLFKLQTLPACKIADADGKLRVVDGEIRPDHILRDMRTVCEYVLSGKVTGPATKPTPGSAPVKQMETPGQTMTGCPGQLPTFDIPRIVPTVADQGRVPDLHTCPIILLFGGPGSGRTDQAEALCRKLPGLKHFNITEFLRTRVLDHIDLENKKDWDVIARRVHSSDPPMDKDVLIPEYWDIQVDILKQEFNKIAEQTRAVVIEGFPNDENQLNAFNEHIGGVDLAILLDCEEDTLQKRLIDRYNKLSRTEDEEMVSLHRILFFKHCTLPVVRHYDEKSLLVTVPADREADLVLNDVVTVVEYFLGKQDKQGNNSAVSLERRSIDTAANLESPRSSVGPATEGMPTEPEITKVSLENIQTAEQIMDQEPSSEDHSKPKRKIIFITGNSVQQKRAICEKLAHQLDYRLCVEKDTNSESQSLLELVECELTLEGEQPDGYIVEGFTPTQQEKERIMSQFDSVICYEVRLREKESEKPVDQVDEDGDEEEMSGAVSNLYNTFVDVDESIDNTVQAIDRIVQGL